MKVAVIHNLARGGARRRLEQQLQHVRADIVEICLSQALPVTDDPIVVPDHQLAPAARRLIRPPVRYLDLATLTLAWMRVAVVLRRVRPDVIFANPCQLLQAPAALIGAAAPSLYFCDEPRATESDPRVRLSRNDSTRAAYAALYAAERLLDRAATLRATVVATNSRHTAAAITAVYGRSAAVLPMGVPESFTPTFEPPAHLLSVASLTPDKGHELVLRAAAAARSNWPVTIVAPRPHPSAERALTSLADALRVQLTIRTAISDDELIREYRRAQATLYLAREEPFGLASLEAQACGSPVVVAAEGGLPETLLNGVTGWAIPRTALAAAGCIDRLDELFLRERMARAAAEHAARSPWSRAGDALYHLLQGLYSATIG